MRTSIAVGFDKEGTPSVILCKDDYASCLESAEAEIIKGKFSEIHCYRSPDYDRRFIYAQPAESEQEQEEPEKKKPGRPKGS